MIVRTTAPNSRTAMLDVFRVFLRLGLTSFGGPTAHLGYFRRAFVEQRDWLDAPAFAAIVAFCSVLPGPTSSQAGMLIGLTRAGAGGAFAAWLGFTLPSAIAMTAFALALGTLETHADAAHSRWFAGALIGLTAAAAAVVAQAVLALTRSLCIDAATRAIALGAAAVALALAFGGFSGLAWLPIVLGAGAGFVFARGGADLNGASLPIRVSQTAATIAALVIAATGAALCVPLALLSPALVLLTTIARAGTLVFGGGHVVLPLLQGLTANGLLSAQSFYGGYGAVQAMPGPLFTFAAFIGAANTSPLHGMAGAAIGTIVIFAPSFALAIALAPLWNHARSLPGAASALRGANASVVGLLAAVLVHPMLTTLAASVAGIIIAGAAYAAICLWKCPPWIVVIGSAAVGALAGQLR